MAGTLNGYFKDESVDADVPRNPSTYVSARTLAGASEQITIPAGATYARVKVTAEMTIAFGANPTAVTPSDIDDGTASEGVGPSQVEWYYVKDIAKMALFGTGNVTVSFYKI